MFTYYVPGTVLKTGDIAVKKDKAYTFLKDHQARL